ATYVALRQGGFTLLERGDIAQAEAAERMAVPVAGTTLRVAAALPRTASAPFGLEGTPLFVAVGGLLLLAYLLWRLPAPMRRALEGQAPVEGPTQTLAEALIAAPAGDAGSPGAD